jgi:hypothetical protein
MNYLQTALNILSAIDQTVYINVFDHNGSRLWKVPTKLTPFVASNLLKHPQIHKIKLTLKIK